MPHRPVTVSEVVHWTALAAAGVSLTDIARESGRAPVTVRHHIPPTTGRRGRHLTDAQRTQIIDLVAEGLSWAAIRRLHGYTHDTIRRVLAAQEAP